jgi:DNA helicase II / ATP-dependent DNA helicase PcrA
MSSSNISLVIAGPGAGKTRALTKSILDDIDGGFNPLMINAMTFTRTGANEITKRTDFQVNATTIHKVAARIISLAATMRGTKPPMILGPEKSIEYLKLAVIDSGAKYLDVESAREQIALIREMGVDPATVRPEIKEIWKHYRDRMLKGGCIDLTGLLERAAREMKEDSISEYFSGGISYLDEGQDTNPHTDWPIFKRFMEISKKTVIYLSPSQVIYDFRGSNFQKLSSLFPEGIETIYMNKNYRSTPEIVTAGVYLAEDDAKGMVSTRESIGIPVKVIKAHSRAEEAETVAMTVGKLIQQKENPGSIAILGRTWSGLFPIMEAMKVHRISYNAAREGVDLYERPEVMALVEYIAISNNPKNDNGLETIINYPFFGIGTRTKALLRGLNKMTWDHLIRALGSDQHRNQVKERILGLLDIREYLSEIPCQDIPVEQQIQRIIETSGIAKFLNDQLDYEAINALDTIKDVAKEFGSLVELERYLREQMSNREIAKESVVMKTIHSSKGEEWDTVILPSWNEGNLPMTGSPIQSEQRLAFVGVTRPKNRLVITLNNSSPSRFLRGIPAVYG